MKILITGAFGFVGSNLSRTIKADLNAQLIALDINQPAVHSYNKFFFWNELNNIKADECDAIIHLAGKAHDLQNNTDEKSYFDINLGLTKKIYDYFLRSKASKLIFFSSVKAVADKVKGEYLSETDIPAPQTSYGKSKLAAENYLLSQPLQKNKKIFILRPCMIHGPGNKGNLNLLYKLVKKGIPWPLGNFENKRSFTSIDNLAFIINEILTKNVEPGIYQVADDETISTNGLIQLIAESKQKRATIWCVNKNIIFLFARIGDIMHLPINSERLKKLTGSYVVSNEKLKKALDIENMPVHAEKGMQKTLRSF